MTRNNLYPLFLICSLLLASPTYSQGLLDELEGLEEEKTDYAFATFKGTRAINLQSPELPGKGVLQYSFLHRFGAFNDDFGYNFLGMDNAHVKLSLDYSPLEWLNLGLAHSSFQKVYEGYAKYRLVRQSSGKKTFPFTITGYSAMFYQSLRFNDNLPHHESERLSYVHELVVARKFTPEFSAEIVPSLVHYNLVEKAEHDNNIYAIGIAARYKLSNMVALSLEYIYQINPHDFPDVETGEMRDFSNPLSIGVDIETGGHVFQLFLTNSRGVSEPLVFGRTPGKWSDGDIHFGFNISRVFTIKRPKIPDGE